MVPVTGVEEGSLAEKAGIRKGDVLLAIDSHPIRDILDYRFFLTEKQICLSVKRGDDTLDFFIRKNRYDDIGLEFETFLMDRKRRCANRCIFCFIDQNPPGMRETVYFKDDDTRLSFLMGNYVTLTNVSDEELNRIISMRMSPVNVSVHTTNPELRKKMLGNPRAGRIMEQLRRLKDGKIQINCQIVACRGINDGGELEKTVRDLETLSPYLQSIAVVPAGLTRHREGLYPIAPYDGESAKRLISQVERMGKEFLEKYGSRLVYAADEFYLSAAEPLPPEEHYDGYPQLDNGVGLLRNAREEILEEIRWRWEEDNWKSLPKKKLNISLATGYAALDLMKELTGAITEKLPNVTFHTFPVPNRFFGESVTVAGLICGNDLIETARTVHPEILFFPAVSLRHERDKFLDDVSVETVQKELACPIYCIENGTALLDQIEALLNER